MQTKFQAIFRATSVVVLLFMCYYINLSVTIYFLTQKLASKHEVYDLPQFSKIFWVPFVSAFALFAFKRQLQNASTPIFMLICKD
jgi:hypothetical protein